jgi:hypothetical protein
MSKRFETGSSAAGPSVKSLRFVPSRVEGLPEVSEVRLFPDRIEARSAGKWLTFRFIEMVRWPQPVWFWRLLRRATGRPVGLPVGDRDWFHSPPDRYFSLYTDPRLVLFMPTDEPDEYGRGTFAQIQYVLSAGGFSTLDLG